MIEIISERLGGLFLPPDDRASGEPIDYELGGIGIGDSSEGSTYQIWVAITDGVSIWIHPENSPETKTYITSGDGITFIALAFDQLMRPTVAYTDNTGTKLYWYDSIIQDYTTTTFPGAKSPKLTLDLKNKTASDSGLSDIQFFYIKNNKVYHRTQRDRYGIEYDLGGGEAHRISRVGMCADWRLRVEVFFRTE